MVFNINDYQGNYVMHCRNQIEARSFCAHLHSLGKRWAAGQSYLERTYWEDRQENTCYSFNNGCYGSRDELKENYTILEWKDFMYDTPAAAIDDNNNYDPNVIRIAGYDFIKFPEENGIVPIMIKDSIDYSHLDQCTNNFAKSYMLRHLTEYWLPIFEDALGAENVLEFETDLTAVDGRTEYGTVRSRISLPTLGFYKANIELFDKYASGLSFYLATPITTNGSFISLISYKKLFNVTVVSNNYYIRPILYVKASAVQN